MPPKPLPIERVCLARDLSEPALGADDALWYVQEVDGRPSVMRQWLRSGLAQPVASDPQPSGGLSYGGGLYSVHGGTVVYAGKDGRLYGVDLATGRQWPVTPPFEGVAAPAVSPCGRFVAFAAEQDGRANVFLTEAEGRTYPVKLSDDPWYAWNPVFSGDGARIAWQEWDERDMPWDQSRLRIARLARAIPDCGSLADTRIAGVTTRAKPRVAYGGAQYSPDGARLAYVSDETGWRSLWIAGPDGESAVRVDLGEGEIGRPDWLPALYPARFLEDGRSLIAVRRAQSRDTLWLVDAAGARGRSVPTRFTRVDDLAAGGGRIAFVGSTPTEPAVLVTLDLATGAETERATTAVGIIDSASLSRPEVISWPTGAGERAWGIFYPAVGAEAEPRPTLLFVHGGPTSEAALGWALGSLPDPQYFATRGYHVLTVNHRGSTGYGRAYQERLQGQWGVVDQEDYRSGAEELVRRGLADSRRLVIAGGSAGGYATLLALTRDPEFWAAGISLYGIGDLYDLRIGSHRFEVEYEQGLIGPLPEAGAVWKERSPLTYVDRVRAPLLLFHGTEDKAVPHRQSVQFAEAVRRRGGVAELVSYEGEGHGFVQEETKRDVLLRMERFLDRHVLAEQRL